MFAGIIKEIGIIKGVNRAGTARRLLIKAESIPEEAGPGDSISVDGVCLTVTESSGNIMYFDVMSETLGRATLGFAKPLDVVNLEPALRLKDFLGGHPISGHVDGMGRIENVKYYSGGGAELRISVDREWDKFIVAKGSIAVDGISLTVNGVKEGSFSVNIIPQTIKETTIGRKRAGDYVNIELDMAGKYIQKNNPDTKAKKLDKEFLKEHGFF